MNETENIIQRLRLIAAKKLPCDDIFIKAMLIKSNPMIKQWAIAAANQVKDQDSIDAIMQQILAEEDYYDVRLYVLCYLARNNHPITIVQIDDFLKQAVTAKQKSMIYNALAISNPNLDSLLYLQDCLTVESDNDTKKAIEANTLKIAKIGLIKSSIDKNNLKHQFPEVYKKTKEGKIEKDIQAKIQEKQQSKLFEATTKPPDFSETPEKSMNEIEEENYINDMIEFNPVNSVEFVNKRVYTRDLSMIRQFKKGITECKICGMDNISFDAHHIIPLKSGGADDELNVVCVCRNCHARFHADQIRKVGIDLYELTNRMNQKLLLNAELSGIDRYSVYSYHFFGHLLAVASF